MSMKLYRHIIEQYRPLARSAEPEASKDSVPKEWIDRAYELCKKFTPQHSGGDADADNPVYAEAVRQINEQGILLDPALGKPTPTFVKQYAYKEIEALVYTACLTVAELEMENGRHFHDSNIESIIMKAMEELYTGKMEIKSKALRLSAGMQI